MVSLSSQQSEHRSLLNTSGSIGIVIVGRYIEVHRSVASLSSAELGGTYAETSAIWTPR